MLKAIGIIAVITVSTLIGFKLSENLRVRYKKLTDFTLLIGDISDRIRTGTAFNELIQNEKAKEIVELNGLKAIVKGEGLTSKDKVVLEDFFMSLGLGDTESEIKKCETYLSLVKKQRAEAEEQVKAKAGLYSKLGFFAGLFVAVILV